MEASDPGAPPRGRPKNQLPNVRSITSPEAREHAPSHQHNNSEDEYDLPFGIDLSSREVHDALNSVPALGASPGDQGQGTTTTPNASTSSSSISSTASTSSSREALDRAVKGTQTRRFFSTKLGTVTCEDEDEDDGEEESDPEEGKGSFGGSVADLSAKPWFRKPGYMSDTVYAYFGTVIKPLLRRKEGTKLVRPFTFENRQHSSASLWVEPADPIFSLSRHQFNPNLFYYPRVFLWLPHFLSDIKCPNCNTLTLEKNGATPPRRITDIDRNYYIVSWQYYCRSGCQGYFSGWSPALMRSVPRWLSPTFPADLSSKSGLDHKVVSMLRVANQHKMGPSGVHDLLVEQHTHRYNVLLTQYLEAGLEVVRAREAVEAAQAYAPQSGTRQSTLHAFLPSKPVSIPTFGHWGDAQGYGGFVPSVKYLTTMMNHAIERDEDAANQHTALLAPDQIAIDDSHKITKHIAKDGGVPVFKALWTCMDSRYIRAQVLTLTKAHDERMGPLIEMSDSMKRYGYPEPPIAFSDDPVKDKALLLNAFPSLGRNLTSIAAAYGLEELTLPPTTQVIVLNTPSLIEASMSALMNPVDAGDENTTLAVGFDAEWNMSRSSGVSVIQLAPESCPNEIFIIPVHKLNGMLPTSLLRILVSSKVYKAGSSIQADFTRLKKQFPQQLSRQKSFNLIDLKEFCIQQRVIKRTGVGSLDALVKESMRKFLPKEDSLRKTDDWEHSKLRDDLQQYAALDAYASLAVYLEARGRDVPPQIGRDTPPGTRITLYTQDGGLPIARGTIPDFQPGTFQGIPLNASKKQQLLITVDVVLVPTAPAVLHWAKKGSKRELYTLEQLQIAGALPGSAFQMVVLAEHLQLCDPAAEAKPTWSPSVHMAHLSHMDPPTA